MGAPPWFLAGLVSHQFCDSINDIHQFIIKIANMNNAQNPNAKSSGPINNNKRRAENKDNLDSREGEEQLTKGDDRTHNKKETKSEKPGMKNKENK